MSTDLSRNEHSHRDRREWMWIFTSR